PGRAIGPARAAVPHLRRRSIPAPARPQRNAARPTVLPPYLSSTVVPAHGPIANARLIAICVDPMYSPRRDAGAMSVTYAASDGKRNISPNVQITTVAATLTKPRANASAPKPVPNRKAPIARVRRCGQCAVAELI